VSEETEKEALRQMRRGLEHELANFLDRKGLLGKFDVRLHLPEWHPFEAGDSEHVRLLPALVGWGPFSDRVIDEVLDGKGKRRTFRKWANNLKAGRS
jgi:hypothetical protein